MTVVRSYRSTPGPAGFTVTVPPSQAAIRLADGLSCWQHARPGRRLNHHGIARHCSTRPRDPVRTGRRDGGRRGTAGPWNNSVMARMIRVPDSDSEYGCHSDLPGTPSPSH